MESTPKCLRHIGCQSGLVFSELDSRSEGSGFESYLIQNSWLIWGQAMPGSISAPNSGSFENKKNTGSQMGHAQIIFLKVH